MRSSRAILIVAPVLVILVAAWLVHGYRAASREEARIRIRYQQLRLALTSADTNAARALFAPEFRGGAHLYFEMLENFAKPLGPQSSVRLSASTAQICPERIYHYGFLPGGHTIKMVKVDGQWLFTGAVHID